MSEVRLIEILQAVRVAAWLVFMFSALLLMATYLFPSMRGPSWTDQVLTQAIIFALLAIALKP